MPNLLEKRREYMCDLRKAKNEKYVLLTILFRTQARQKHENICISNYSVRCVMSLPDMKSPPPSMNILWPF